MGDRITYDCPACPGRWTSPVEYAWHRRSQHDDPPGLVGVVSRAALDVAVARADAEHARAERLAALLREAVNCLDDSGWGMDLRDRIDAALAEQQP